MRWRDFDALTLLPDAFFDASRRVHFIGIGGIGMSALALALHARGHIVSGSDATPGAMTRTLQEAGITCVAGHHADHLDLLQLPVEALIYGSAIAPDNPERVEAQRRAIPQWHRAQLLAFFVNGAQVSIAVSGTHGKSTTSAMIAHILEKCGLNPTALLGAEYPPFGSNARLGDPNLIVVEADESDGSFTLLHPTIAVITNVEAEHLENYDDSESELWRAFKQFASQAKHNVVLNGDDAPLIERLDPKRTMPTFGSDNREAAVVASNIHYEDGLTVFDLDWGSAGLGEFRLGLPGKHNVMNALAALTATDQETKMCSHAAWAGQKREGLNDLLMDFGGVKRRFQRIGEANGVLIFDDYGHHPTEVRTTLETAREFLDRPILAIFQPHRYSRTQQMGHEFGPSFEAADRVIITQLYSAFETPIEGVSGRIVFDSVAQSFPDKPLFYAANLDEARRMTIEIAQPGDAIVCLGAGDIATLGPLLLSDLQSASSTNQPDSDEVRHI